jgi:uncharacterized DUF497 family protein
MEFEWDDSKSVQNLRMRGFGFDYAACIFDGPTVEAVDDRRAYGEIRIRAIGQVDENVLVVIYTDRHAVRRIVSARKANGKERQLWQSFVNP